MELLQRIVVGEKLLRRSVLLHSIHDRIGKISREVGLGAKPTRWICPLRHSIRFFEIILDRGAATIVEEDERKEATAFD